MKIKISRSFSRKNQVKKFEDYIESFCGTETEVECPETDSETRLDRLYDASKRMDDFCRKEVNESLKTAIEEQKPACARCGGVNRGGGDPKLDEHGLCAQCAKEEMFKQRENKVERLK